MAVAAVVAARKAARACAERVQGADQAALGAGDPGLSDGNDACQTGQQASVCDLCEGLTYRELKVKLGGSYMAAWSALLEQVPLFQRWICKDGRLEDFKVQE